jgi:hypothetical protein
VSLAQVSMGRREHTMTLWDIRTGWPDWFAGVDIVALVKKAQLEYDGALTRPQLKMLQNVVVLYMW